MKLLAFICLVVVIVSLIMGSILDFLERRGKMVSLSSEHVGFKNYGDSNAILISDKQGFSDAVDSFIISAVRDTGSLIVLSASMPISLNLLSCGSNAHSSNNISSVSEIDEEII